VVRPQKTKRLGNTRSRLGPFRGVTAGKPWLALSIPTFSLMEERPASLKWHLECGTVDGVNFFTPLERNTLATNDNDGIEDNIAKECSLRGQLFGNPHNLYETTNGIIGLILSSKCPYATKST
jgi:hypothetical protein